MLSALLVSTISVSFKYLMASATVVVSFTYLSPDQQSYWYARAALAQALASLTLAASHAAEAAEATRVSEYPRTSRQMEAALERFEDAGEEFKIVVTRDWAALMDRAEDLNDSCMI